MTIKTSRLSPFIRRCLVRHCCFLGQFDHERCDSRYQPELAAPPLPPPHSFVDLANAAFMLSFRLIVDWVLLQVVLRPAKKPSHNLVKASAEAGRVGAVEVANLDYTSRPAPTCTIAAKESNKTHKQVSIARTNTIPAS